MKKIINGKKYDTDTAQELGTYEYGLPGDYRYFNEMLYCKKNGEYFLYGEGGPASKYAAPAQEIGTTVNGKDIVPLTVDSAKKWAEKHLEVDEYEDIFGEVSEGEPLQNINIQLNSELSKKLASKMEKSNLSQQEIINKALESYL